MGFSYAPSPYLVPFKKRSVVGKLPTRIDSDHTAAESELKAHSKAMQQLQSRLLAANESSLLVIFQAMDAAGKDGTINAVLRGLNPSGVRVASFRAPSDEELEHDFLWRIYRELPDKGSIGIFNRSHYEEVLVVRVHPQFLKSQHLPQRPIKQRFEERFESIRHFEKHLARNGTRIIKFFLNVSRDEQRQRLLARIDDPEANWKFRVGDVDERAHWQAYMDAYSEALSETSRPYAPWYAIPADDKGAMRVEVAKILVDTLRDMNPKYPVLPDADRAALGVARMRLLNSHKSKANLRKQG